MTDCVLAIDVGGSAIKAGLVDEQGVLTAARTLPTERDGGPDEVLAQVTAAVQELEADAERGVRYTSGTERHVRLTPVALGVAVLGLTDDHAGVAVLSANLGWREVPVRAVLEHKTTLPIAFGHDVRAGGLAEAVLGAGRGAGDHLFVAVGTGLAAALMLGGRPYVGTGFAGEIGHIAVDSPAAGPCGCGGTNCLETVASGGALVRRYAAEAAERVTAAEVAARAAAGEPVAARLWQDLVDGLADGLAGYLSLLAPELIVIGGGLATAGDQLLEPLRAALARRVSFQRLPAIVPAELGERAGCLGAGLMAWQYIGRPVTGQERP